MAIGPTGTELDTVQEPKRAALTPENVTRVHQAIWTARGDRVGRAFELPPCPYSADELAALDGAGRRVGYLPPEVATQRTRHVLGEIFPLMGCYSLQPDNEVANIVSWPGWFDYESSIDAPYLDTDEAALLEQVSADGRELMSMNQYIVATQDSNLFTGQYLDERRTWTRIGIRVTGRIVCVRCDGDEMAEGMGDEPPVPGSLLTGFDLHPSFRSSFTGGRTFSTARSQQGVLSEPEPSVPVRGIHPSQLRELDLDVEWQRQVGKFIDAGFHTELGMSVDDYVASLPQFAPQPPEYWGRLDMPIVVEARIPWERQYDLIGIYTSPFMVHFPKPMPSGPDSFHRDDPYAAWFNKWGQRFAGSISPGDARAALEADEVGANLQEGGAMISAYPELNSAARFFDFIGYVFPAEEVGGEVYFDPIERTPGICRWRGRPEFACNLYPLAFSVFRPLIRGRAITTSTS